MATYRLCPSCIVNLSSKRAIKTGTRTYRKLAKTKKIPDKEILDYIKKRAKEEKKEKKISFWDFYDQFKKENPNIKKNIRKLASEAYQILKKEGKL